MLVQKKSRTLSSDFKHCGDEFLREIMVQMVIDSFINVRAMIELLQKTLPERKDVDIYMINNVRLRARRKKLELDSYNIQLDPKHFDSTFINSYVDTANNYTLGNDYCFCIVFPFISFV